jgi:hypothetical protein
VLFSCLPISLRGVKTRSCGLVQQPDLPMKTSAFQTVSRVHQYLRCVRASWVLPILLLLSVPAAARAQFNYVTKGNTITITGYSGSNGAVTIPATTNGLPVTSIGDDAIAYRYGITSVTIPSSVTNIGTYAF